MSEEERLSATERVACLAMGVFGHPGKVDIVDDASNARLEVFFRGVLTMLVYYEHMHDVEKIVKELVQQRDAINRTHVYTTLLHARDKKEKDE